ncbi:unnamed protein product [Rotaria magnacalcarata]|uniref:EB domain-containing protein n=2 Tax=Rotaria magnacalcarata TaxID=392030 RepID=A0A816MRI3_9BILA|nr:unnamed protein product [Rotaria magnacalcarata]CAF1985923.1 unnamed protein product [Rotaria magnacalcarata]CAF2129567.1 unnamed protein product [Rotaria magnacalcarata]CAF3953570.1 unnamed protein product [Rotaria magnacalcarata]CAF3991915.1 unnamed protein product [Rotaria magnacalcarata]
MQVIIKPIIFLLLERFKNLLACQTSLFSSSVLIGQVKSQICNGMAQYERCSTNAGCACLHIPGSISVGICSYLSSNAVCSQLVKCGDNNRCYAPNHECLYHPKCQSTPICFPVQRFNGALCPLIANK